MLFKIVNNSKKFNKYICNNRVVIKKSFILDNIMYNENFYEYKKSIYLKNLINCGYIKFGENFNNKIIKLVIKEKLNINYDCLKNLVGKHGNIPKIIFENVFQSSCFEKLDNDTIYKVYKIIYDYENDTNNILDKYYYYCKLICSEFNIANIDKDICIQFSKLIKMDSIIKYLENSFISNKTKPQIMKFIIYSGYKITKEQYKKLLNIFFGKNYTFIFELDKIVNKN